MDALNNLVMTNLLTNLLFLIVGLGYGVTFVLMKGRTEKFWLVCRSATTALLFMNGSWLLLIFTGVIVYEEVFEQLFYVCVVKESLQSIVICLPYPE